MKNIKKPKLNVQRLIKINNELDNKITNLIQQNRELGFKVDEQRKIIIQDSTIFVIYGAFYVACVVALWVKNKQISNLKNYITYS